MSCGDCFGLGVFLVGILYTWLYIITEYFSKTDNNINEEKEKE